MGQEINLKFGASLSGGAKAVFASLSSGLGQVAKGMQKVAKEQLKLGKKQAATALNETAKGLNKLSKELGKASTAQDKFAKSSKKVESSTNKLSGAFSSLGKSIQTYSRYMVASNLILGVIGGFKASAAAVIEYDQALQDLKAITLSSATETLMLGETIVKVAQATKFSMAEVGGAMKKLAQAGFSATEVTGMIGDIAELATGSLESLDVTVKLVSTAIRVFGLEVSDTKEVVDIFSNAVNKSRLTVSGLNTTFNYIGPIAAATGLTLKDTSASMMLLANAGLRFSTIGTGLRRIIGGLAKPSGRFKDAILSAGYSLADFNPNLSSFRDILSKLPNVVKDSTDAIEFFGYRGSSVISAFATQGVAEYDRLREATNRIGTTSEMAAVQMKGLQNAIKNIKDRFGVLAKTLGEGGFTTILKTAVDLIRKFLSILIELASNPITQAIGQFALLTTGVLGLITALGLLRAAFVSAFSVNLVTNIATTAAGMMGMQLAGVAGASGVTTLSGALAGLRVALTALLFHPVTLAIAGFAAAGIGLMSMLKANEKSLRNIAIEQEKYSSSLDTAKSKLNTYRAAVAEHGEDSEQAKAAVLNLKDGVYTLAGEYTDIADPLYEFTKRVDENTGKIIGSKDAIKDLENVLNIEYKKSALEAIAAAEKLAGANNLSAKAIRTLTRDAKNNAEIIATWTGRWKKFAEGFGATFDTTDLDFAGLDAGLARLEDLEYKASKGNEKAKESLATHKKAGEQILSILEEQGLKKEELLNMTEQQIIDEIVGLQDLTYAHKTAAAAIIGIIQQRKEEALKPGEQEDAAKAAAKALAELTEAYKLFGLSIKGTTSKFDGLIKGFDRLLTFTDDATVSSENLVIAFTKVGKAVKTSGDFHAYIAALESLKEQGRITEEGMRILAKVTEEAFESVRTSASDLKDALDEKLKIFDIEELEANAAAWKSYVEGTNTEHAITEKTHKKNLEKINLDSLKRRMLATQVYFDGMVGKYKKDTLEYKLALVEKEKANLAFYKAQAAFNKPDTSGGSGKGPSFAQKESAAQFDAMMDKQLSKSKELLSALKADYKTRIIDTKMYYAEKRRIEAEAHTEASNGIKSRIAEVQKEYAQRISLETEKNAKDKLASESKIAVIALQKELTKVNSDAAVAVENLNIAEFNALETQDLKIQKMLQEAELKAAESGEGLPGEENTMQVKFDNEMAALTLHHQNKLAELIRAGGNEIEQAKLVAAQQKEIINKTAKHEKAVFDQRIDNAASFMSGMSSLAKQLADSGLVQSKKAFKAYQAFAIAETMISTYKAAQDAYAGGIAAAPGPYGMALGLVQAAVATAQGMARIAQISSQKPSGYSEGGLVRGPGGPTDDKIPARLSNKEYVQPEKSVSHYGVGVMEAIRNRKIPKSLLEGWSNKKATVQQSFALAGGGQVPAPVSATLEEQKQPINIVNVTDPREISNYLATSEGSNALMNVLSSKAQTLKRILR